jgi:hypothetical protein
MSDGFVQVFAFNHDTGEKRTANSEWNLRFLATLTEGSTVFEERREWDTAREEQVTVTKAIGVVRMGDFGHTFERTARFN